MVAISAPSPEVVANNPPGCWSSQSGPSAARTSPSQASQKSLAEMQALSFKASVGSSRVCAQAPKQQRVAAAPRVRAEAEAAPAAEKPAWAPPALDSNTPSPIFGGSTGEPERRLAEGR